MGYDNRLEIPVRQSGCYDAAARIGHSVYAGGTVWNATHHA
jgi:hypothetical protein